MPIEQLNAKEIEWLYNEMVSILPKKDERQPYFCSKCVTWHKKKKCEICGQIARIERVIKPRYETEYDEFKIYPKLVIKFRDNIKKLEDYFNGYLDIFFPNSEEVLECDLPEEEKNIIRSIRRKFNSINKAKT